MTLQTTMYIERGEAEIEVSLTADYTPPTPDVRYLRNGDPGHPGDRERLDITAVVDRDGEEVELTAEEEERAKDQLLESAAEN